jgi:hypothetical protein
MNSRTYSMFNSRFRPELHLSFKHQKVYKVENYLITCFNFKFKFNLDYDKKTGSKYCNFRD